MLTEGLVITLAFVYKRLSAAVVCLLALAVIFASTQARLSQYKPVIAPTGIMAKTIKLAECRFQKQLDSPVAVLNSFTAEAQPPAPEATRRSRASAPELPSKPPLTSLRI